MYTGKHAHLRPLQPAFIMASTGETVTYRELLARSNRLAHLFRNRGLTRLDHYAIFMENNGRYLEACGAGERSGLYFSCVNSYLTASELAYILTNSQSRVLITSRAKLDVAREALKECPKVELCIVSDGEGESDRIVGLPEVTAGLPETPIADESLGTAMLYSSGTTGRPKGILRPLPEQPPSQQLPVFDFLQKLWQCREGMIYLSPAPLYHSAPQAAVNLTIRVGGTVVIMESFDPERYLELVQQWAVTYTQRRRSRSAPGHRPVARAGCWCPSRSSGMLAPWTPSPMCRCPPTSRSTTTRRTASNARGSLPRLTRCPLHRSTCRTSSAASTGWAAGSASMSCSRTGTPRSWAR
jgi:long-chain acyl-CoA synthetase